MQEFLWKLLQSLFVWTVSPATPGQRKQAQLIIAVSFGTRKPPDGNGESNSALAWLTAGYRKSHRLPVVTQGEISDCRAFRKVPPSLVVYEHRERGKYLDTYEALAQAVEYCRNQGFTKALLVAHPQHMLRCKMVLEKKGIVVLPADTRRVPYDPLSAQIWTRNAMLFTLREIPVRLMYLLKGWV